MAVKSVMDAPCIFHFRSANALEDFQCASLTVCGHTQRVVPLTTEQWYSLPEAERDGLADRTMYFDSGVRVVLPDWLACATEP